MENRIDEQQLVADMESALARMLDNATIYLRVVKVYFNAWPENSIALHAAWSEGNRSRCAGLLHKLGGGAKSLAAEQLAEQLKRLERILADDQQPWPNEIVINELDELASQTHLLMIKKLESYDVNTIVC